MLMTKDDQKGKISEPLFCMHHYTKTYSVPKVYELDCWRLEYFGIIVCRQHH